jgi:hypothetical protein
MLIGFLLFINAITEFRRDYVETYPFNVKKIIISVFIIVGSIISAVLYNSI